MSRIKLNLDSLALLLFCLDLSSLKEVPLSSDEWRNVEKKLKHAGLQSPASLIGLSTDDFIDILELEEFCVYKMIKRVKVFDVFLKALHELENKGVNITTKYEDNFPKYILKKMKKRAPLFLYYCGQVCDIDEGISIAGLSDVVKKDGAYTKRIIDKVIEENMYYISNNTKGIDTVALHYCLHHGGKAICVVSDNLIDKSKEYKRYLKSNQLVMISAVDPSRGFNVTNAIDRNGYVCGLSRYQIVISSVINNGATWFTVLQNMHHLWTNLLVIDNNHSGNSRLLDMGTVPMYIKDILMDNSFDVIYEKNKKEVKVDQVNIDQMSIFEFLGEEYEI